MKRTALAAAALLSGLPLAALAQSETDMPTATAELMTADGTDVGTVTLTQGPHGVLIEVEAMDMPEGGHGFHIHQTGACTPDFQAAGSHFNPTDAEHGAMNEAGPHAGDLPNLWINADGTGHAEFYTEAVSLEEGAENSLMDDDGSAMMVHAQADDYMDQDSAGDRLACGVIEAQ